MSNDAGAAVASTNGDVTNVAVNYTKKRITITTSYTDLDASGSNAVAGAYVVVNAINGRSFVLGAAADATGTHKLYMRSKGKAKACYRKLKVAVDTDLNTITLSAPSSCVASSKRVVLGGFGMSTDGSVDTYGNPIFANDDAFIDGVPATPDTVGVSPVIARGGTGVVVDPAAARIARPGLAKALAKAKALAAR